MKKLLALLLTALTLALPALATVEQNLGETVTESYAKWVHTDYLHGSAEAGAHGITTAMVALFPDGQFLELDRVELAAGTTVVLGQTVDPFYAATEVEIIAVDGSYATRGPLRHEGAKADNTNTLRIQQTGTYIIRIRAAADPLFGAVSCDFGLCDQANRSHSPL